MSLTVGYKTRSANGLSGRVTYSKKILQNFLRIKIDKICINIYYYII